MIWINGEAQNSVSANDRGLLFGDGCFTTLLCRQSRLHNLDLHMARLQRDSARLGFAVTDPQALRAELVAYAALHDDAVIRCTLTRGVGGSGYAVPDTINAQRILSSRTLSAHIAQSAMTGVKLGLSSIRLAMQPLLAGIKHCNRLEQVLARAELNDSGCAENCMLDTEGHLVEGIFSNIFWRDQGGQWHTPALTHCGVAGVMRELLLEFFRQNNQAVSLRRQLFDEILPEMSEAFVCNSIIGIWPVVRVHDRDLAIGGDTRRLQDFISFKT